jgi:TetR/AcrR family transcriptional regulator, regulator of cefoperazone and chloramphenicol sensitivity
MPDLTTRRTPIRSPKAMPTRPATGGQLRGDRTRAAIIDETVRCVIEEGFEAASAKHIAERAGVTWGVIQYHFGDRAGILAAVVDAGFQHLRETVGGIDLPAGDTRQRVAALVDAAWGAMSTPTSRASFEILVATRSDRDPQFAKDLDDMARELARLAGRLTEGRQPLPAVGRLLWATLRGLVLAQIWVPERLDPTAEREALVDLLAMCIEGHPTGNRVESAASLAPHAQQARP